MSASSTFTPDLTPFEVMALGAFCDQGGYFRNIYSSVTGSFIRKKISDFPFLKLGYEKYENSGHAGLITYKDFIQRYVSRDSCNKNFNCYRIECGSSLSVWESKGWIKKHDPYGWFEWYCNFYYGRRIEEYDIFQIQRWINVKRRFEPTSIKKKQVLLHWAISYETKEEINRIIKRNLLID
jgi:hypothetical protein